MLKITVNGVNLYSLASESLYQLYMNLRGVQDQETYTKPTKCELLNSVVNLVYQLYCKQDWKRYASFCGCMII